MEFGKIALGRGKKTFRSWKSHGISIFVLLFVASKNMKTAGKWLFFMPEK